jgi:uncharacterized membrane protein
MLSGRLAAVAILAVGGMLLKKKLDSKRAAGDSSFIEDSIEVDVPVRTAYDQWTQFEDFPKFMKDVESVRQVDDTHLHWRARVAGRLTEWGAEITHQLPDRLIAWHSTSGPPNSGAVTFDKVHENRTRIMLRMSYQPRSMTERVGDAIGAVKLEVAGNLHRFAEFIQGRRVETGAWRGTVEGGAIVGAVTPAAATSGA